MPVREGIYGLIAEFNTPTELIVAAKASYKAGYRRMDCYTPYPVEEAAEAIGFDEPTEKAVPLVCLLGGILGGVAMFTLETWISVWAYPLNIAGRPLFSWPAFVVPAYEWTILFAGLSAGYGMLALNRLPAPYHPVFNAPNFRDGATTDKFFLCLEADDPQFSVTESRAFLESFRPVSVVEVDH
ncbi:MAG TPA: DUF3341 domain-containing protein [Acidobacteriaceae bacterium]|jgi:hypothetical protein|nr:DUF3341 domain-containing protein [Acidobacteriaceae bacterium]